MKSLAGILSEIFADAFAAEGLPRELGAVRVSDRPDLAQFQCNGALAAAKIAGKKPRDIAEAIVKAVSAKSDIFTKLEIAGPGFVNIAVSDDYIARHLTTQRKAAAPAKRTETILLDYGGPNIAKPMHVGHLRSSIIGDALRRICARAGYTTISDVHLGDWGTQMGQVISEMERRGRLGKPVSIEELEEIYPAASAACKNDAVRAEQARAATVKLQNGDPLYRQVWKNLVAVSIAGMKRNFAALGVHFDLWNGESSVHDLIAPMVESLKTKGFAVESDGALVVPVARDDDKKEIPPLILYKRDGAVMYSTTDLATVVERVDEYKPAKIVYVVDQRQNLHFEQVFRAARKAGIAPEGTALIFAGFGTMNGTDGKPFKTRAGGAMKLEDLIAMAVDKARARLAEAELGTDLDDNEREAIAHKVAIAAIKFADLHNNRVADYVFDIDRMTAFEGKTGPYLLYQAVRIGSLLEKAGTLTAAEFLIRDADRDLALAIAEFPDHFAAALDALAPHILCDYAFRLAQVFSSFYARCHILSETDAALRASRLALCAMTRERLVQTLSLLGINVPARM